MSKAQDKFNFGKILSINLENKDIEIMSMGHRNVQGLYYDKNKNLIWSSEHGPKGGDEVNLNDLNEKNNVILIMDGPFHLMVTLC